jgi:alanine racemase
MKIAIIPLGYADGLQRSWGKGKLKFLYKNQLVPVLGNISMDSCVIDITSIKQTKEGDKLLLFGKKRSIFSLAKELETIPYEITAGLSKRIKRIFL